MDKRETTVEARKGHSRGKSRVPNERQDKKKKQVRKLYTLLSIILILTLAAGALAGGLYVKTQSDQEIAKLKEDNKKLQEELASYQANANAVPVNTELVGSTDTETENSEQEIEAPLEVVDPPYDYTMWQSIELLAERYTEDPRYEKIVEEAKNGLLPESLVRDLANNREMLDYVAEYTTRYTGNTAVSFTSKLTEEELNSKCPLLLQWDERWGYQGYGDQSSVAVSGCGPTSLAMAIVALTHKPVTPGELAEYAMNNGYYMYGTGTLWALMKEVPLSYGIAVNTVEGINITQGDIDSTLEKGGVVVCSVKQGDFTVWGHFIVIYAKDENGYYINDPFCKYRSSIQWTYEEVGPQLKAIFCMTK